MSHLPFYVMSRLNITEPAVFIFLMLYVHLSENLADSFNRLGKRELIVLLLFICDYLVSVRRSFLFPLVLGIGCVILLCHSLARRYNYLLCVCIERRVTCI